MGTKGYGNTFVWGSVDWHCKSSTLDTHLLPDPTEDASYHQTPSQLKEFCCPGSFPSWAAISKVRLKKVLGRGSVEKMALEDCAHLRKIHITNI